MCPTRQDIVPLPGAQKEKESEGSGKECRNLFLPALSLGGSGSSRPPERGIRGPGVFNLAEQKAYLLSLSVGRVGCVGPEHAGGWL